MKRLLLLLLMLGGCVPVPPDPPTPPDPPQPPGPTVGGVMVLNCRTWHDTLDETAAHWTFLDTWSDVDPEDSYYLGPLPGQPDESLRPHSGIEAYRKIAPELPWVFCVQQTDDGPKIIHQGPPDVDTVLGWVGLRKASRQRGPPVDVEHFLDVDFMAVAPELCGYNEPGELEMKAVRATAVNVRDLPGFEPIPQSEVRQWAERIPRELIWRLTIDPHISDQVMGSCVGHSAANGMEAGHITCFGLPMFDRISAMSMYTRIGRSPGSGAYIGDAADELENRGILPADGESRLDGTAWEHTHQVAGGFYDKLPAGWESTGAHFKAVPYYVDDKEAGYRVSFSGLRRHLGRSRHAISGCWSDGRSYSAENSWGRDSGSPPGMVHDSRFYSGWTYLPVCHEFIPILTSERN